MTVTETNETTTSETNGENNDSATLLHLDPQALIANEHNPRKTLREIKALAASIKEVGVVQPLLVERDGDGFRLIAGWRRATAAIEAGLATVPCVVESSSRDTAAQLCAMVAENVARDGLSSGETAAAYRQMSLAGVSAARIAKVTGQKKADVEVAIAVGANDVAVAVATRYDITMEQAAAIAELSDDREIVKELTTLAVRSPWDFEHRVSRIRQDREREAQHAALLADCEEKNLTVIERPEYGDRSMVRVRDLYDDNGRQLSEKRHERCPGHAVAIVSDWSGTRLVPYCMDWKANGHRNHAKATPAAETPDAESARAERKEVIENNKAWRAAEPVRRQFVANLCARRSAPKGLLRFAVGEALSDPSSFARSDDAIFAALSGTTDERHARTRRRTGTTVTDEASEAQLPLVLFVHVASAVESQMGVHTWRHGWAYQEARYLSFLAELGYALSAIEQRVVDEATASFASEPVSFEADDLDDEFDGGEEEDEPLD